MRQLGQAAVWHGGHQLHERRVRRREKHVVESPAVYADHHPSAAKYPLSLFQVIAGAKQQEVVAIATTQGRHNVTAVYNAASAVVTMGPG